MRVINFLIIFLFMLNTLFAEERKIKIAVVKDMFPYSFVDDIDTSHGIFIDYWKKWAEKNNIEIEFIPYSKEDSIIALNNEEVDIHSGLFKDIKLLDSFDFVNPIYPSQSFVYFNTSFTDQIKSIDDLKNKNIGLLNNNNYESYLYSNFPNVKIKNYEDSKKLYKALSSKEIDFFIDDSLQVWFQLISNYNFNKVTKLENTKLENWFYSVIKKDNEELKNIIKNSTKEVSIDEIIEIEKKWIIKESYRYFEKQQNNDFLTKEERKWLRNNTNISLAVVKDWDRYSSLSSVGVIEGFHIDLIKKINEILNSDIKIKVLDTWSKAYNSVISGETTGIPGLSWSKSREEIFNYTPSYYYSPYFIVTRKDNKTIKSLKDFNTHKAATFENSITNNIIKKEAPLTNITHVNSIKGILKAIYERKVDAALLENARVIDLNEYNLKIVDSIYSKYSELSIGTLKENLIFSSILSKAINSIKPQDLYVLKQKWLKNKKNFSKEEVSYINNSKTLKVGIEDWTAIIEMDDNKNIEGIAGEIVIKALSNSGLKLKYIKGSWDDLLESFKKGEIDILPTTLYTKQRAKYGDFSKQYLSLQNYIYVKSNNNDVKTLSDLNKKKIAIQKGFATITLIKERFPNIEIIETKNLEESIQLVLNNEVDALFEIQVSVESKLRDFLVTNLKSISQNSIKAQGLHIFLQKNKGLLNSVLNKSLDTVSELERNQIISKWLNRVNIKKEINIALTTSKAPYVLNEKYIKGIEYDLLKKIFELNSIKINKIKKFLTPKMNTVLLENNDLDLAVNVKENKNDGLFYSEPFIEFNNIIVSRKKDNIQINKVSDLYNKKVIAFSNAHKYLGKEYHTLFNLQNRPRNYKEYVFQDDQVKDFLNKKVDLIILDENIFKWHFNKLSKDELSEYKFNYLLSKPNKYKVAFKNQNLRDIFNKNLEVVRSNGDYKEIVENYIEGYIESKLKINFLISSVISKAVFEDNHIELEKLLAIFTSLPYIEKIDVFNNKNILISEDFVSESTKFTQQDSYYLTNNLPQKVGYIKVYFNNKLLEKYKNNYSFIPQVNRFDDLESYEYILSIYKRFGYINDRISFDTDELHFLEKKRIIKFSSSHWQPLSITENDKHDGLLADYIKLVEKRTNLKFEYVESKNWLDVLEKFKNKEIDLIPGIGDRAYSFDNALISMPFTSFKYAIVSNKNENFIDGLRDLRGRSVAIPKGYSSHKLLKNSNLDIKIIETSDEKEALSLVARKEADAFVAHSAIAIYNIKNNFPELKIVGLSNIKFLHHFLIQDDYPELLSILNKVIYNITPKEKQDIKYKWIQTEVSTAVDYSVIYTIITIFSLILLIVLIFTRKLSQAKKEIELKNQKIENTIETLVNTKNELIAKSKDLEEQKEAFETLFYDTADGLSLLKDGKFIECNNAALNILDYKNKEKFLNLKPHELSPEYQPDGEKSELKAKKLIDECLKNGSSKFEWIHLKSTGDEVWISILLTKIVLNHEPMIHVVWRDITDKKILEKQILDRNNELEDANNELEISIDNLQQTQEQLIESEKMASLGALVAGVAHEINTPIGIGLTGASHFLEISNKIKKMYENDKMTQESFEDFLNTSDELAILINSNLKKAANLVKSFKQVAVDQTSEEKREFLLRDYIEEILASIHSVTKKTKLDIFISCDEDIKINSFPGAISQVLTNLIMNSIIHAYEKGEKGLLSIYVTKEDSHIKIIYKDNGKGIKEENISKIFDPFFTTNRENGGSGLGLNIIYNIVTTKLNGKITCENKTKGVEFIITFEV